jgi:hypothetical protein
MRKSLMSAHRQQASAEDQTVRTEANDRAVRLRNRVSP